MANLDEDLEKLDIYDKKYTEGNPVISDTQYDIFRDQVYRRLPAGHPRLSKIGHDVNSPWVKEKHDIFMGSQNKALNPDDLQKWFSTIPCYSPISVQGKIDGFSMSIKYVNGKLSSVLTRNDGETGENITANAKLFRGLPHIIPVEGISRINVRAEGFIYKSDFEDLKDEYKNARNAAAGIARKWKDNKYASYISIIAYDISVVENGFKIMIKSETEKLNMLRNFGFQTPYEEFIEGNTTAEIIEKINLLYEKFKKFERVKLPYEIDALVVKVDSVNIQDEMGIENGCPNGQIAYKFDSASGKSIVTSINSDVGRTGIIIPTASIEPVDILGVTITSVTLHNYGNIQDLRLTIGSEILVERRGDIIPYIREVTSCHGEYNIPEICPSCGKPVVFDGVNLWCENDFCKSKIISGITHWFTSIGMLGFKESFFEKLYDNLNVRMIHHVYCLTPDQISPIIGDKMTIKFFDELDRTSIMTQNKLLSSIGIPGIGEGKSSILIKTFGGIYNLMSATEQQILDIDGFADISAAQVVEGIKKYGDIIREVMIYVVIKETSNILNGKSFCVTGALNTMGREEFKNKIISNGGIYKSSVSKGLDYLVTNNIDSGSSKNKKAEQYGTKIINEDNFIKLLKNVCISD